MFQKAWCQYFGQPRFLRVDPDGAWKANENLKRAENEGLFLDMIPGEAHHWNNSIEEAIREVKGNMHKQVAMDPELSGTEAFFTEQYSR